MLVGCEWNPSCRLAQIYHLRNWGIWGEIDDFELENIGAVLGFAVLEWVVSWNVDIVGERFLRSRAKER